VRAGVGSLKYRNPFGVHRVIFDVLMVSDTYVGRARVNRVLGRLRRWNEAQMCRRIAVTAGRDPLQQPCTAVAVVRDIDPARFRRDYQRVAQPVLLQGAAESWPAMRRWSLEYFDERLGCATVVAVDGKTRDIQDDVGGIAHIRTIPTTLHAQLRSAAESGPDYLCFDDTLFQRDPAIRDDLLVESLRPYLGRLVLARRPVPVKLFIGGRGTSTQWHTDALQTTFVQLRGEKEWYLSPPAYSPCLDARVALLDQQYVHSMIDFRAPDLDAHVLYSGTPVFHVRLEPGDVLYVPSFWWHCVVNPSTSVGVSIWWYSVLQPLRAYPVLLWLTALSPQHLIRAVTNGIRKRRKGGGQTGLNIYGRHDPQLESSAARG
jgi:hypothetical protein